MSTENAQSASMLDILSLADITSWDDHYDNPQAEVILVSNDKVGFRVGAWQFGKESGFIRDLMTFPFNQNLELTPIELDHDSKIIRYFIDFVISHSTQTTKISMTEFRQLFQLSDKFQADQVEKDLMVAMGLRVQQRHSPADLNPWTVFQFAASRDNADLARASVLAFEDAVDRHDIYEAPASKFDGIPDRYIAGLLLAGYDMETPLNRNAIGTEIVVRMREWKDVAANFSVI